ncbi:MAG: hypothetical protein Q6352_016520 [Candidatus Freyrarchaeum guaymaensis]
MDIRELPTKAYIPLGRRGIEAFKLRECLKCGNENEDELEILDKQDVTEKEDRNLFNIKTYKVRCKKCGATYRIIIKSLYVDEQKEENRMVSAVHYAENGEEQWLGVF